MKLSNGYELRILPAGTASPMANHRGGEIAVDDENLTMYAWGIFVACYGLDSIVKACLQYKERI